MRKSWKLGLGVAAMLAAGPAIAADHIDGTTASGGPLADPTVDITDTYGWMSSDASTVNLIMNVYPNATTTSTFSSTANYVFHVTSQATELSTTSTANDIICKFTGTAAPQPISCWVVNAGAATDYATGNASVATAPVKSADSKMTIFAGLRNDPFFFNLAGFKNATSVVAYASTQGTTFIKGTDSTNTGCPILTSQARGLVAGPLAKDCTGSMTSTPVDFFNKSTATTNTDCITKPTGVQTQANNGGLSGNVMSIVLSVDKTLLNSGGPIISVWGATTH